MLPIKISFLGFSFLLLSACGGGGGGSDGESVNTGQFIDSAVSGIRYETATRSGITNGDGQFEYLSGETVRFYIGEQLLGDAQGAATVTLFDLVDGVTPVVGNALLDAVWNWKSGPGFSTVINLATLLQTLDSDGNPENGIEVDADIAELFAADSVDFDQHWQEFNRDSGFRHVLVEAKANALLDENRQIRAPWRAMEHLYRSLGIDSDLSVVTSGEAEEGFFGGRNSTFRYEFDAEGKVIREEFTVGFLGSPVDTYITTYTYDAVGNLIRLERVYGDNSRTSVITYAYDSTGDLIRSEQDYNFDGVPDYIATYTHDANGNQTRSTSDDDGDGIPNRIYTNAFDADGNLVRQEYDTDGSEGTPAAVTIHAYDAHDNVIRSEEDWYDDGTPDAIYSYSYDDSSNLLAFAYDGDADGSPDYIENYSYDGNSNLLREEYDYYGDGSPDQILIHTYDDSGNLIQQEIDYDGDGVSDSSLTFTYDSNGNVERGVGHSGENSPDQILIFTYDANNNLTSAESYFDDENNTLIYRYSYTWDSNVDGWWAVFNSSPESNSFFPITL